MQKSTPIIFNNTAGKVATILFVILTIWWISLNPFSNSDLTQEHRYIWGSLYQIIALIGGLYGLYISKKWGGLKSIMGKTIILFSIGLLLQVFGQSVYSYYNLYAHIDTPYPSIGDIGFFGTIPAYFFAGFLLTELFGIKSRIEFLGSKILLVLVPYLILAVQYVFILRDYDFDWNNKLKIFLDLGYPMGDALIISIAILAFLLSFNALGGLMKKPIMFLVVALFVQYFADIYFFYEANRGANFVGAVPDFLYSFSYLVMTLALVSLGETYKQIKAA